MKRMFLAPLVGAVMIATATPALAQWPWPTNRRPTYGSAADARRVGFDNGYREGISEGEKDGRRGDSYRYQDENDFRRADVGYRRSYGDINLYRQGFRQGFADGYRQGYSRFARNGNGRYRQRDDDRRYGGYGSYDPRYGGGVYRGGYNSVAYENGLRDGVEKGREDIRKNRSFDPRRHEWYREGDRNYNNRYGSRDQYKVDYRSGFNAGYDQGYRQARYGY